MDQDFRRPRSGRTLGLVLVLGVLGASGLLWAHGERGLVLGLAAWVLLSCLTALLLGRAMRANR